MHEIDIPTALDQGVQWHRYMPVQCQNKNYEYALRETFCPSDLNSVLAYSNNLSHNLRHHFQMMPVCIRHN